MWIESFRKREAPKTINNFYKKNKHIEVELCYALNETQVAQVENSFPKPYSLLAGECTVLLRRKL